MVDTGVANLGSVVAAFQRVGADVEVTAEAAVVERARALVLPGVGAFRDGMAALERRGLVEPIRRHVLERRRPILGICLGMQLLAEASEEHGQRAGLGLVRGRAARLQAPGLRVPNIGWCDVRATGGSPFARALDGRTFYFAHSYHVECDVAAATLDYGGPVAAALEDGPVRGVQFHPEKSQDAGLDVLAAFAAGAGA
jgi:glutamine amidotransferase